MFGIQVLKILVQLLHYVQNNGFIVKWEDAIEFNTADAIQPIMQFYSVDTNTIYPPILEIKWDDSSI
jgi:hypothetical protein